jgi:hypothetical protein
MALIEEDIIIEYIGWFNRAPLQAEVEAHLNDPTLATVEDLYNRIASSYEGQFKIPDTEWNAAHMIVNNWTGLSYNQAYIWVDALYADLGTGNITIQELNREFVFKYHSIAVDITDIEEATTATDFLSARNNTSVVAETLERIKKSIMRRYNLAVIQLHPEFTLDEEGNIVDLNTADDRDIRVEDITNNVVVTDNVVSGEGVFDAIMGTLNTHIDNQYNLNRLKGSDYAEVYLGLASAALNLSFNFVVQEPVSEENMKLTKANVELTRRKTV